MTKKLTGLAGFNDAQASAPAAPAQRGRGQGDVIKLTTRVTRADWARLRQIADAEGRTVQSLSIEGLTLVMRARGLPDVIDP